MAMGGKSSWSAQIGGAMTRTLTLAYPPSTNRLTRTGNGRAYANPEAKRWKADAHWLARSLGFTRLDGPVAVSLQLHPKTPRAGAASKTRIDLDNAIKATLDAMNGAAWDDDSQVVELRAIVAEPMPNGGLTVSVWPCGDAEGGGSCQD